MNADRAREIITKAPSHFKSSAIYEALPNIQRSIIRSVLGQYIASGALRVTDPGRGSRPTFYTKTQKFVDFVPSIPIAASGTVLSHAAAGLNDGDIALVIRRKDVPRALKFAEWLRAECLKRCL